jgi:3D (Asp-Asp-Asp) domain-containing protein
MGSSRLPALLVLLTTSTCTWEISNPKPHVAERLSAVAQPTPSLLQFTATAYCISGITKSGVRTRRGIVAADPRVLPLGSRIRVHGAGPYSGVYDVRDTGAKVRGRLIDIYMPRYREARQFGRRRVHVEVLEHARR